MTQDANYITWLKTDDVAFRAAYSALSGGTEVVQDPPVESEDGLSWMISTWFLTDAQVAALEADRDVAAEGGVQCNKGSAPAGFVAVTRE